MACLHLPRQFAGEQASTIQREMDHPTAHDKIKHSRGMNDYGGLELVGWKSKADATIS